MSAKAFLTCPKLYSLKDLTSNLGMSDTLVQAYLPLFFWTGLGLLSFRWLPDGFPRFLGRSLYWVGVPLQIFTLARQTHFSERVELAPSMVIFSLLSGMGLAWVGLQLVRQMSYDLSAEPAAHAALNEGWHDPARRGSFVIASMLGNTGFVGLAIAPSFIDQKRGKPLASDMGKDSAAVERSGAAN